MKVSIHRMRVAIWLLVAYVTLLTVVVWGIQKGLWEAMDSNFEVLELRTKEAKLPCSSEVNSNCVIFIK